MEALFLFYLWDMEEKKTKEGEKEEFTVVITNLPATVGHCPTHIANNEWGQEYMDFQ